MPWPGACGTTDWATLGAGRTADVGATCAIQADHVRVQGWPGLLAAAEAGNSDARLGTLGAAAAGCVSAVGSGAALAAARPDGSLAQFQTFAGYLNGGAQSTCPITLVEARQQSGAVVERLVDRLAARTGTEVIVVGIGSSTDLTGSRSNVLYTISGQPAGWLTSSSTRQLGLVTLPDLTATLLNIGRSADKPRTLPIDGSALTIVPASVTPEAAARRLETLQHRSGPLTQAADRWVAAVFAALGLAALTVGCVVRRRGLLAPVVLAAVVTPAALTLVGAVPWYRCTTAPLALGLTLFGVFAVLMLARAGLTGWCRIPPAVAGSVLTLMVLSADAVTGGLMQRGSLLNPWPMDGGRWYGFGNVTFAVYATAGVVVVGYLTASRTPQSSRSNVVAVLIAVALVVLEGWPAFGADFGGLLALGPPLAWLLATSGWRRRPSTRVLMAGAAATVAGAVLLAWLDWSRGVGGRSYLGNFVQRVLDADAGGLLLRKATAVLHSVSTPIGVAVLILGVAIWVAILTQPGSSRSTPWWHPRVSATVLSTAVLGTLLNDSGIAVFATVTVAYAITVGSGDPRAYLSPDGLAPWARGADRPTFLLFSGSGLWGRRRAGWNRGGWTETVNQGRSRWARRRALRSYAAMARRSSRTAASCSWSMELCRSARIRTLLGSGCQDPNQV